MNKLWGRITGKDKKLKYAEQQAVFLGRTGDYTIIYPYGVFCDLPADVLLKEVGNGAAIPVTVTRPADTEQGEPVIFHPATNTRIIFRNNGDIDVYSKKINVMATDVNATCDNVNMNVASQIIATVPLMTLNGNLAIIGSITATGDMNMTGNIVTTGTVTNNGKNIGSTHRHTGSPTAPSGAISNTGAVV